jgi:DNA-binding winged helix-turn-helix (wHTH) protein/Tol biopolymer transport system component
LETHQNSAQKWRFGVFKVDAHNLDLRRSGVRIKIREQSFRVLIQLLEHAGELVSREDLCRALWPSDTFVDFDHSLNTAVKKLRDALGDVAGAPLYIETIPKRGYRFVAPVMLVERSTPVIAASSVNGNSSATRPSATPASGNGVHASLVAKASPVAPPAMETGEHYRRQATKGQWGWYIAIAAMVAGAVLVIVLQGRWSTQGAVRLAEEKRVTANPAEAPIRAAVVSPDGKYLAYADTTGMYLRQIDSGEIHLLPLPKDFRATPSSWFPDGTHLLLTWRDRSGQKASIRKYSILGGAPQLIIDDGEDGVVSPDGSQIAFFHRSPAALFGLRANPILHVVGELWIVSSDGQNPRRFVVPSDPNESRIVGAEVTAVSWAPDGRRLAYIERHKAIAHSRIGDQSSILTRDLNGGEPQLILGDHHLAPEDLCWARDGRLLYAMRTESSNAGGDYDLYSIRISLGTGTASGSPQRISTGRGWIGGLSITEDGKRVLLWRGNALPQVFLSEFDNVRKSLTAPRRLTLDESPNQPLAWLPDGRTLLFSSNRNGAARLYKQRIDETIGEVALERQHTAMARLAPDGSEFLFAEVPHTEDPLAPVRLMRIPLNGGEPARCGDRQLLVLEDTRLRLQQGHRANNCVDFVRLSEG